MNKRLIILFLTANCLLLTARYVYAQDCNPSCSGIDECQQKINECQKLLEISVSSTKPHEQKAKELEDGINAITANVASLDKEITRKKKEISVDEKRLETAQGRMSVKVRDFYKKDYSSILEYVLGIFFSNKDIGETIATVGYRQSLIDGEKRSIAGIAVDIVDLGNAKKKLEESQDWLEAKKINLELTLVPVRDLIKKAKDYQSQLSTTVGTLSARQQQLLAEKTGNFQTSVGDVPAADDPASRPDYNPGFSPAFAGFSFGAPHRKGMSQYGAYGRAKSGQNFEEILRAYYPGTELKNGYSTDIKIIVSGYGSYNIEDYVKRVYEVPNSWGDNGGFESLKAQAIAARSYALAYTGNGSKQICATETCQVFKPGNKGGNWERAVSETSGKVLLSGGQPYSAWYAASSGGYNTPGGWDTKCGNQGCWTGDAFEKIANSPWFYKAWYKPRGGSGSRSHPWLNKDEFVDIVNANLLYQKDNGSLSHLGQPDKSNSDTWSRDEVKNKLGGDVIGNVNSINVTYSTNGFTNKVHIDTDKGNKDFDGEDFRQIFNLRAPGEIYLASGLYNFEKK